MTPPVRPEPPSPFLLALMRASRDATSLRSPVPPDYDPTPIPVAQAQMAANGITDHQRQLARSNNPRLGDAAYANITPFNYNTHAREILNTVLDVLHNKPIDTSERPAERMKDKYVEGQLWSTGTAPARDDAWRVYLGLPQKDTTLGISDYQPTNAKTPQPYFKVNHFPAQFANYWNTPEKVQRLVDRVKAAQASGEKYIAYAPEVMGHYQFSHGVDPQNRPYLAYYDKWDLDTPGGGMAGHPYDIYDRIYYDPQTYKVLPQPAPTAPAPRPVPAQLNLAAFNQAVSAAAARVPRQTF